MGNLSISKGKIPSLKVYETDLRYAREHWFTVIPSLNSVCPICSIGWSLDGVDFSLAFLDISPVSEGHTQIIPKCKLHLHLTIPAESFSPCFFIDHAVTLADLPDEYLKDILPIAKKVALSTGVQNYNLLQVSLSHVGYVIQRLISSMVEQWKTRVPGTPLCQEKLNGVLNCPTARWSRTLPRYTQNEWGWWSSPWHCDELASEEAYQRGTAGYFRQDEESNVIVIRKLVCLIEKSHSNSMVVHGLVFLIFVLKDQPRSCWISHEAGRSREMSSLC